MSTGTLDLIFQASNDSCFVQARFDDNFDVSCDGGSEQCIHWVELKYKTDMTMDGPK